jgi:predicted small lipoprotein YifL
MAARSLVVRGWRWAMAVIVIFAVAAPLSACGKKGKLIPPDGAEYPKDYPTR